MFLLSLIIRELKKSPQNPQGKVFLAPNWIRFLVILVVFVLMLIFANRSNAATLSASSSTISSSGAASLTHSASAATCTVTAPSGACFQTYTDSVRNNVFSGPTQTLTATSLAQWTITANDALGGTAVLSYPDEQHLIYQPIGNIPIVYARFGFSGPTPVTDDYETAFDIWYNNAGCGGQYCDPWAGDTELMIWEYDNGQLPAGHMVDPTGFATINGEQYKVWYAPNLNGPGRNTITLVRRYPLMSGLQHIGYVFAWLRAHGYMSTTAAVLDVEWGMELCSTSGLAQTFNFQNYHLTVAP